MSTPDARHRALLRVLAEHRVRFVLIGGVALQLRGYSGATRDVDITIATDPANVKRLNRALLALNAHTTTGVGEYAAWSRHATAMQIAPDLTVQVASASDVLLAKEHAARPKDLDVLPRVRAELLASGALSDADVRGPVVKSETAASPEPRYEQRLGPRPQTPPAQGLWDRAADMLETYRTRWSITDDPPSLGDVPARGSDQANHRQSVERKLRRLERLLARDREPPGLER